MYIHVHATKIEIMFACKIYNHSQILSFPELEYAFKNIKCQGYKRNDEFRL